MGPAETHTLCVPNREMFTGCTPDALWGGGERSRFEAPSSSLSCLFVDLDCLLAVGPGGGGGGGGRGPSRCCILGPWWGLPNVVYSLLSLFSCFRDQPAVPPRWELTTLMAAKIKLLFSLVTSDVAIHLQGVPFLEQVEAS